MKGHRLNLKVAPWEQVHTRGYAKSELATKQFERQAWSDHLHVHGLGYLAPIDRVFEQTNADAPPSLLNFITHYNPMYMEESMHSASAYLEDRRVSGPSTNLELVQFHSQGTPVPALPQANTIPTTHQQAGVLGQQLKGSYRARYTLR